MVKRERKDLQGSELPIPISLNNATAEQLRNDLINAEKWIKTDKYENQYKKTGTTNALDKISETCIFCQQKLTIATGNDDARSVEHFRPKSKYWWLSLSWDNLFPVCIKCNKEKDDNFDCLGTQITNIRIGDLAKIHFLATDYQSIENPKLLHPELDTPEAHLEFTLKGNIKSNGSTKGEYTIDTCKLERLDLIGKIKNIFDTFEENVSLILFDGSKTSPQKQNEILRCYFDFQNDSKNDRSEFSGFKRYIFKHFFTNLIRDYLSLLK